MLLCNYDFISGGLRYFLEVKLVVKVEKREIKFV